MRTGPSNDRSAPRRPYALPRLKTYGDLAAITLKNGGTTGMNDQGAGPDKTTFG